MARIAGIKPRRGTTAEWAAANAASPSRKLDAGELGYDSTTKDLVVGDGTTAFASLPRVGSGTYAPILTTAKIADTARLVAANDSASVVLNPASAPPLLDLDYAGKMALGGIETFTRSTTDTYLDRAGVSQTAAINAAAFDRQLIQGGLTPLGLKASTTGTAMAVFNPATLLGLLPANEYTIVIDVDRPMSLTGNGAIFSLDGGSTTNRIEIGVNSNYQPYFVVQSAGSVVVNAALGAIQSWFGGPRRLVMVIKGSAFVSAFDGNLYSTTSSGAAPVVATLTNLRIGGTVNSASYFTGWVRRVRILPVALTAAQAVELSAAETPIALWGDSFTAGTGATTLATSYGELMRTLREPHVGVFNGGVSGETSTQIKTRQLADTIRRGWTSIIWAGRNNPTAATVLADVQAMVANLTHTRYLVLSVMNRSDGTENSGSGAYNNIIATNAALATAFPNNYLDLRSLVVAASGGSNDAPSASWTTDGLHFNDTGYAYATAQVATFLRTRGWY